MSYEDYIDMIHNKPFPEKLNEFYQTMRTIGSVRVNIRDALFRQNKEEQNYWNREYTELNRRGEWLYNNLMTILTYAEKEEK